MFKNLSEFTVKYLDCNDILHFVRLNEDQWTMNDVILSNDRVKRDYDYFTSHWGDYEVIE